jgi:hypothetical protein
MSLISARGGRALTENAGSNQGGRFQPGKSGNPAGKPKGARHRVTLLAEKLMSDDAEAIVKKVVDAAKSGDLTAAKIVLDRIAPVRKDCHVTFELPKIATVSDAITANAAILKAVADGELTPDEAASVSRLVEGHIKIIDVADIDERLRRLEGRLPNGR